MNFSKKAILAILFLALVGTTAKAQKNNFSHTVTLGGILPLLQHGSGFHVGYNPDFSLSPFFAVEGQLSYYCTKRITSGIFTPGYTYTLHSVNLLAGGRLYFTPEDKKVRPYVNLLIGGFRNRQVREHSFEDTSESTELIFGVVTGAYVNIKRFTLGVSTNTPKSLIFKVGYNF